MEDEPEDSESDLYTYTGPKEELRELLSDLSEEHWAASWVIGLEFMVWSILQGVTRLRPNDWTDENSAALKKLSEETGGWWSWGWENDRPRFVLLAEWLPMYEAWSHK